MASKGHDHLFKFILIGDPTVRKIEILLSFADKKTFAVGDTAGNLRFHTILSSYYRGPKGIMLVYDVTDKGSFNNIPKWLQNMQGRNDAKIMLIRNRCDEVDEREVSEDEGKEFAKKHGLMFAEVCGKKNSNIDASFQSLAECIYEDEFRQT